MYLMLWMRSKSVKGRRPKRLLPALGVLFILAAANATASEPLDVYVVNYPLAYFAERIGGEHVRVVFPAPPDVDPVYWIPNIETIAEYQRADLILLNGAGYAKWVDSVSLPRSRLVNTSKKYKERWISIEGAVTHSHGPEGDHAHEGVAFTTWLDFDLAAAQAGVVMDALVRKRPELKQIFQDNFASLEKDLKGLDAELLEIASANPATPLIASHPVYDYLAGRYGLNIESVHWEPDQTPDAGQWHELKEIARRHPAKWMIWEGEPDKEPMEKLKEMGIGSLVFDPCAGRPEQGDFMDIMRRNVKALKKAFIQTS